MDRLAPELIATLIASITVQSRKNVKIAVGQPFGSLRHLIRGAYSWARAPHSEVRPYLFPSRHGIPSPHVATSHRTAQC
jgi:hypothetical protein